MTPRLPPIARERWWRLVSDARRWATRSGSARSALDSLGGPDRRNVATWMATTAAQHHDYRQAHPVPSDDLAVVCVSMRPERLESVLRNVQSQREVRPQFFFVANDVAFDHAAVRERCAQIEGAHVLEAPDTTSLGAALNLAMASTDARYVAKFDDDDLYGPHYLADALRAHRYSGAGVVGKHTYYAHLEQSDETILRFPRHEFEYSSTLAGGTLVIDRDRVGDLTFDDVSIGEDRGFIAACHRRTISTFSADRFNFVQIRHGNNTWTAPDAELVRRSVPVGAGLDRSEVDR